jgi:MOZ/SAS family/MYST family zinc finger domain/RNA binding activity-knot of a chromodomain
MEGKGKGAKGAKGGKGGKKGLRPTSDSDTRKYSQQSDGAFDINYLYKIKMTNGDLSEGKIIDCRPLKEFAADPTKKRDTHSYEYYIHYKGFNRRWDWWATADRMTRTESLITHEPPVNKKKKIDHNTSTTNHNGHSHAGDGGGGSDSEEDGLDQTARK